MNTGSSSQIRSVHILNDLINLFLTFNIILDDIDNVIVCNDFNAVVVLISLRFDIFGAVRVLMRESGVNLIVKMSDFIKVGSAIRVEDVFRARMIVSRLLNKVFDLLGSGSTNSFGDLVDGFNVIMLLWERVNLGGKLFDALSFSDQSLDFFFSFSVFSLNNGLLILIYGSLFSLNQIISREIF